MRLIDIISGPWAIRPEMLEEIHAIYGRHMRGEKIDLEALQASTGLTFDNQHKPYQVIDGVALFQLDGVISKRMNLFTKISGGVSTDLVARDLGAALEDRDVSAIVLAIDSPGGGVDGTPELAEQIYRGRDKKPILAFSDGMIASAAYWIGSAAHKVLISSDVVMAGSIGVVTKHIDTSEKEKKAGIAITEITAGTYKRIASQHAPLTEAGRANIQEQLDHIYSVFVDAVATHRGVETGEVLERMADGRIFTGQQAIEAGLVDGVSTLAEAIDEARAMARNPQTRRGAGAAATSPTIQEDDMNLETLKADHPELVEAIEAAATDGKVDLAVADDAYEKGVEYGRQEEMERVADVRAQLVPGHEALIEEMAADGESTGEDAALAIVKAEQELRGEAAAELEDEAGEIVPPAVPGDGASEMKRADFNKLDPAAQRAQLRAGVKVVD